MSWAPTDAAASRSAAKGTTKHRVRAIISPLPAKTGGNQNHLRALPVASSGRKLQLTLSPEVPIPPHMREIAGMPVVCCGRTLTKKWVARSGEAKRFCTFGNRNFFGRDPILIKSFDRSVWVVEKVENRGKTPIGTLGSVSALETIGWADGHIAKRGWQGAWFCHCALSTPYTWASKLASRCPTRLELLSLGQSRIPSRILLYDGLLGILDRGCFTEVMPCDSFCR